MKYCLLLLLSFFLLGSIHHKPEKVVDYKEACYVGRVNITYPDGRIVHVSCVPIRVVPKEQQYEIYMLSVRHGIENSVKLSVDFFAGKTKFGYFISFAPV